MSSLVIAADASPNERVPLVSSTTVAPGTYLLVARFNDIGTEDDTVDLWLNPLLGASGELAAPDLTFNQATPAGTNKSFLVTTNGAWSVSGIVIDAGGFSQDGVGSVGVDEIRFGTSFADVTPISAVPEPMSVALLLIGFTAVAGWRVRRRRR